MAIAQDNLQTKIVQSDVTSTSWTHTCSGSDRLLLIFVGCNATSQPNVTYNGNACTLVDSQDTLNANKRAIWLYKYVAPPTGSAYTISVTNVTTGYIKAYSVSLTGVNQTTPIGTVAKTRSGSAGTTPSVAVSSVSGDRIYDMTVCQGGAGSLTYTPGASQTEVLDSNSVGYLAAAGSYATGGTTPMSWTMSSSYEWAILAAPIKPVIIAPTVTTGSVTNLAATSATLAGNVTNDGYGTITERGVCWSISANPTTSNSKATAAGTTGSYTVSATGLSSGILYHYRSYAINSAGTSYGSDQTFTTLSLGGSFIFNML